MKKNVLFFGLFLSIISLGIVSCDKVADLVAFDIEKSMPDQHFDVDSSTTAAKGAEIKLYESYFDINLDSILDANGIDKGKISNATFKQISIAIENPTPEMELGFVNSISIKLYDNKDYNDGKTIATASGIKTGDQSVIFNVNNESLDPYFENSKFYYRIYGVLEYPISVNKMPLVFSSKTKFTIKPLK